jgi:pimeloyl-ACP methyl ester carboxylesterase
MAMIGKLLKWIVGIVLFAFAALFIWGYAGDIPVATLKAKYANAESEFVDLGNGLTVHLRDEGPADAPAIILLHGSNASLHTWDQWVAVMKSKYRVIRFDQIGHGLTGPNPANNYGIASFVDTVDKVAANRGLNKFTLGGNSMGGGVSWAYAKAHPEKLDGVILVDAAGAPDSKPKSLPIGFRIMMTPGVNQIATMISPRSMIEKSLKQSVTNQAVVTPKEVDEYWELLRRPGNRDATIKRFGEYAKQTAMSKTNQPVLLTPALIIWGEEDTLIPVSAAKWFAEKLPNNKVQIYKNIGHLPMEEAAAQSANDVMLWLDTIPRNEPALPKK